MVRPLSTLKQDSRHMPQAASSAVPPHKGAVRHADMANAIRALAMDAVQQANSGHPGMPMGMADVATVLFSRFLKFDPQNPTWPEQSEEHTSDIQSLMRI